MSWSVGYNDKWKRFIGYGVLAYCDHPGCKKVIHRGLAYTCGEQPPDWNEYGCGLNFCDEHLYFNEEHEEAKGICLCKRCSDGKKAFKPKPEHSKWLRHILKDNTWKDWREENSDLVKKYQKQLENKK